MKLKGKIIDIKQINNIITLSISIQLDDEEYVTADEGAKILSLSKQVFLNLSLRGDIPTSTLVNGKKMWLRSDIETLRKVLKNGI